MRITATSETIARIRGTSKIGKLPMPAKMLIDSLYILRAILTELLVENNREVERRRQAERKSDRSPNSL